jgi:hypothetical protein
MQNYTTTETHSTAGNLINYPSLSRALFQETHNPIKMRTVVLASRCNQTMTTS